LFYGGHKSEPTQVYRESKRGDGGSTFKLSTSAMRERAVSLKLMREGGSLIRFPFAWLM
jgi:hypothetical protein